MFMGCGGKAISGYHASAEAASWLSWWPSMNEHPSLTDITFAENSHVDVTQLNALYRLIGWDRHGRRTAAETTEMLRASHYHIAAQTTEGKLVGFARVCGDPYVAQVLDVITHPAFRRRGIATRCMSGVVAHLQRSRYVSVTLTDGSGIAAFYAQFGFRACKEVARRWERGTVRDRNDRSS
jgi:ribosomal protein S18 acetylase RimI-like enzyme